MLLLNDIEELDDDALLFAADETAVCLNTNTEEGLIFLKIALDNLIFKVDSSWPRKEIINAIKLLLRFNVFQFGGACYRQKEGRAMGIPFTCLWYMSTFATMKILVLIPKYRTNIIVFKRHTDDIFII